MPSRMSGRAGAMVSLDARMAATSALVNWRNDFRYLIREGRFVRV